MSTVKLIRNQGKFAKVLGEHPFLLLLFVTAVPAIVYIIVGFLRFKIG